MNLKYIPDAAALEQKITEARDRAAEWLKRDADQLLADVRVAADALRSLPSVTELLTASAAVFVSEVAVPEPCTARSVGRVAGASAAGDQELRKGQLRWLNHAAGSA